jgi:hypothetical protein
MRKTERLTLRTGPEGAPRIYELTQLGAKTASAGALRVARGLGPGIVTMLQAGKDKAEERAPEILASFLANATPEDQSWLEDRFAECTKVITIATTSSGAPLEVPMPFDLEREFGGELFSQYQWLANAISLNFRSFLVDTLRWYNASTSARTAAASPSPMASTGSSGAAHSASA